MNIFNQDYHIIDYACSNVSYIGGGTIVSKNKIKNLKTSKSSISAINLPGTDDRLKYEIRFNMFMMSNNIKERIYIWNLTQNIDPVIYKNNVKYIKNNYKNYKSFFNDRINTYEFFGDYKLIIYNIKQLPTSYILTNNKLTINNIKKLPKSYMNIHIKRISNDEEVMGLLECNNKDSLANILSIYITISNISVEEFFDSVIAYSIERM
jgi:hypothetical protein